MAITATYGTLSASDHSTQLRKAVIASTIGTAIEWYDFFIYGTAAGLIFGKVFFPNEDPLTATLAAFGTYFIGFVGRPVGAAIFGHYGDRIGRKATLIATLLCMGIATFLIAFVPTYESIGIWGAVILTVLRMIQGIGVGGEWGGSVLLAMEWSRHNGQRGLVASWPQFGVPCGLFLANLSILAFSIWTGDQFATWGWRIPFAFSIILVGVGLWIRLGILETPVFQQLRDKKKTERTPIIEVIKRQPKEIILSALLRMSEQAPFFIFTAFIFAYAVDTLHMSRDLILTGVILRLVLGSSPSHCRATSRTALGAGGCIRLVRFNRSFWLPIFRNGRHCGSVSSVYRDRSVVYTCFHAICAGGRVYCRGFHTAITLQRRFVGLPACLADRRRAGAPYRDSPARQISLRVRDFHLHCRLRGGGPIVGSFHAGLHRQGHLHGV